MPDIKAMAVSKLNEMSPMVLTLWILLFGVLSGGGGTVLAGNMLGLPTATLVTSEQFDMTFEELNNTLRQISFALEDQRTLLANTRCEIRMLREERDWRDCWLPEDVTNR